MRNGNRVPRTGDVFNMYFDGSGSEQSGWRPAIVFQNNVGNYYSPNVIALPLTTRLKKLGQPTHVLIRAGSGLKYDSMVMCENPKCISKENVGSYITTLSDDDMKRVALAHFRATDALSFVDLRSLMIAWQEARGQPGENAHEDQSRRMVQL